MKTIAKTSMAAALALTLTTFGASQARAGGWAVAGGVAGGLAAGAVIGATIASANAPAYYTYPAPYPAPYPTPIYAAAPAPIVVAAGPAYYYPRPYFYGPYRFGYPYGYGRVGFGWGGRGHYYRR